MRNSEYQKLFGLRNKETGKLILYYWASSQKHKAIFATRERAEIVARELSCMNGCDYMVVEFQ